MLTCRYYTLTSNKIEEELIYMYILTTSRVTMNGKDRVEISKDSKKQRPAFKHVVSEGSIVLLHASDLINDIDTNSIKNYSWRPITEKHVNIDNIHGKDNSVLSFTAPYLKGR